LLRGIEIGRHLARHDIKVEVKTVPASDIDVANAILSHVAEAQGAACDGRLWTFSSP
jgi:hypothetical protein